MKAKKVCTPSSEFLQELSDDLEPISQRELENLRRTAHVLSDPALGRVAEWQIDLANNILGRLGVGVSIAAGKLSARLTPRGLEILKGKKTICETVRVGYGRKQVDPTQ